MADKKEEKKAPITVKFLDAECKQETRTDGTISIKMGKDDYLKQLAADGAPKEVLKATETALTNFAKRAIPAIAEVCKKNKGANVQFVAGSGAFSQDFKITGHKTQTCHNPQTKEQMVIEKYGVIDAKLNMGWGKDFKGEGGLLQQVSSDLENFFNNKKK